ncbi:hypothetical protein BGZ98_004495, partial [Dissophora globulifera]
MLQKEIERFGNKDIMILYIDGPQAEEKRSTAEVREAGRQKALDGVKASIDAFETRIESGLSIRKQHFVDVKKGLGASFYWCVESRESFAEYMRSLGWTVKVCITEADVAMAQDARPGDVIISSDSDMLGYASIVTLWRPVSRNLILVYFLPDLLATIGLSRIQLTALAVVSRNDYQRNIYSLGPATNFGIIKAIGDRPGSREIVLAYLTDGKVVTRNTHQETFADSIRVFVEYRQTQIEPVVLQPPSQKVFKALQQRFKDLCIKRDSLKETQVQRTIPSQENIIRVRKPRSFNRYRTVESPILVSRSSPLQAAPVPQEHDTPLVTSQQGDSHPPLNRTRIPRNRARFSFKERTRKKVHDPPPKMKQFYAKPYKTPPEAPDNQTSTSASKAKSEKDSTIIKKPLGTKGKNGFVRSMAWYHPTVTLETGTLHANTKRVFIPPSAPALIKPTTATPGPSMPVTATPAPSTTDLDRPALQRLVMECLQEAPHLAAGVKRKAQRLIGQFVEAMSKRMDAAEMRVMAEP